MKKMMNYLVVGLCLSSIALYGDMKMVVNPAHIDKSKVLKPLQHEKVLPQETDVWVEEIYSSCLECKSGKVFQKFMKKKNLVLLTNITVDLDTTAKKPHVSGIVEISYFDVLKNKTVTVQKEFKNVYQYHVNYVYLDLKDKPILTRSFKRIHAKITKINNAYIDTKASNDFLYKKPCRMIPPE